MSLYCGYKPPIDFQPKKVTTPAMISEPNKGTNPLTMSRESKICLPNPIVTTPIKIRKATMRINIVLTFLYQSDIEPLQDSLIFWILISINIWFLRNLLIV